MDAISLLKDQVKQAHERRRRYRRRFDPEQLAWKPGGTANPMAGLFMHLIAGEDMFLKMMTGQQPLAMGPYAGKTGASEPHPMGNYGEWAAACHRRPSSGARLHARRLQEHRGLPRHPEA